MNDPFLSVEEFNNELKAIEELGNSLAINLSLQAQKIRYIISKIKSCETVESADPYFALLDKSVTTLTKLVHIHLVGIPDNLLKVIYEFDNIHENKEYYFEKIKTEKYHF
jgi:hypothetical protein